MGGKEAFLRMVLEKFVDTNRDGVLSVHEFTDGISIPTRMN